MCTCSGEDVCVGREGGVLCDWLCVHVVVKMCVCGEGGVLCDWLCVTCSGEDVCGEGGREGGREGCCVTGYVLHVVVKMCVGGGRGAV